MKNRENENKIPFTVDGIAESWEYIFRKYISFSSKSVWLKCRRASIDCTDNAMASGRYLYLKLDGRRHSLEAIFIIYSRFVFAWRHFHVYFLFNGMEKTAHVNRHPYLLSYTQKVFSTFRQFHFLSSSRMDADLWIHSVPRETSQHHHTHTRCALRLKFHLICSRAQDGCCLSTKISEPKAFNVVCGRCQWRQPKIGLKWNDRDNNNTNDDDGDDGKPFA